MWHKGWRDKAWAQINKAWDLIVIGGGITGAGIFREAALSGLSVLLLEAGDFASGTSSRSSKLVHGGLRYLRNGQIKTTFQSVRERQNLLGAGRGLVLPLEFLFIIYERDKIPLGFFRAGLTIYDILGMRWDHRRYKPIDLLKLEPKIDSQGLVGGFRYMDAKVDDARLVLRIIQEGVRAGGLAINYAKVEALLRRNDQSVSGVGFRDMAQDSDGRTYEVAAKAVVNATGTSADALRRQVGGRPNLRILKGSHIVFSQRRLPLARAIGFAHPLDRRPVFALPWEGVTLFGTTDLDYPAGDRREPALSPDEIEYLLSAIRSIFPEVELKTEAVQAGFSGVRAVLDTGQENPSKEPRDHAIWDEKGLVTVAGGKLTTFRIIAQDVLRIVWKRFPSLYRNPEGCGLNQPEVISLPSELTPKIRVRLIGRYGASAAKFITEAFQDELRPIDNDNFESPLWAELRWAARSEAVVHLDDLLLRRIRLGLILRDGAIQQMNRIRKIVQPELGWEDDRWNREFENYIRLWNATYKLTTE